MTHAISFSALNTGAAWPAMPGWMCPLRITPPWSRISSSVPAFGFCGAGVLRSLGSVLAERFDEKVGRRRDGSNADTAAGILTQSLAQTEDCLAPEGVAVHAVGNALVVPAAECDGVILTFSVATR